MDVFMFFRGCARYWNGYVIGLTWSSKARHRSDASCLHIRSLLYVHSTHSKSTCNHIICLIYTHSHCGVYLLLLSIDCSFLAGNAEVWSDKSNQHGLILIPCCILTQSVVSLAARTTAGARPICQRCQIMQLPNTPALSGLFTTSKR